MSNEQAEFAEFFQASWEPCLRAVVAVVGSPSRAEDQAAEAFARAWASWRRRSSRELPLADHDLTAPGGGPGPDGLDTTLLTALWNLPARQREVIALRIFLDLDTGAIAGQRGIEAGTVRMHLSRGAAALRRELIPTQSTEAEQ